MIRISAWRQLLIALLALSACAGAQASVLPSYAQVKAAYIPSDGVLRDRQREIIATVRLDYQARRLDWIPLDQLSPALVKALIAAEDKRFYTHSGVDWIAFAAAAWDNLSGTSKRGASSLSMQLAGTIDPALTRGPHGRTLGQKWNQIEAARALEKHWSKGQIIETYLNLLTFRGELQGISAASWGLFGKHPSGLDLAESSILASLIRDPRAKPEKVAQRACLLARQIGSTTSCGVIKTLAAASLSTTPNPQPVASIAPHLARALVTAQRRDVIASLDGKLQRFALSSLQRHLVSLTQSGVEDGAVVVLDNASGEVLAYVGSSGALSRAAQVDGVTAPRQAGSALKPFLYELALERRLITAATVLDDTPYNLATGGGLYVPQDYDKDFKGPVSVRTALASSLNIPAVRTVMLEGVPAFHERLRALGFSTLVDDPEHYGPAIALGGADVTLLDLANAYRTLANRGKASPVSFAPGSAPRFHAVLDPAASFVVGDILSDRGARYVTFGFDSPLATHSWSAVKTGTSKDMRDNWALGFSDRYTVGVWMGNFSGQPMHNVSGVTGAAPVWAEIMNHLHHDQPSRAPSPPGGVKRLLVQYENKLEPGRQEWFLAGTEPNGEIAWSEGTQTSPRISYPTDGAILALDPDIPPAQQLIPLHAEGAAAALSWVLDGERLGAWENDKPVLAKPAPGKHRLALVDGEGKEVDAVSFQIRGYGEAPAPSAEKAPSAPENP